MNNGETKCVCCKKNTLSFCLKGNCFTGVSKEGSSLALKGFVPNTARYNEWALNFESWRSQVAVEESFPHDVLLTDDPKLLCSCLRKYMYVSNMLVAKNGCLIISSDGQLK